MARKSASSESAVLAICGEDRACDGSAVVGSPPREQKGRCASPRRGRSRRLAQLKRDAAARRQLRFILDAVRPITTSTRTSICCGVTATSRSWARRRSSGGGCIRAHIRARTLSGSPIGGIAENAGDARFLRQAQHHSRRRSDPDSDNELRKAAQVGVKYRFSIDMASLKSEAAAPQLRDRHLREPPGRPRPSRTPRRRTRYAA